MKIIAALILALASSVANADTTPFPVKLESVAPMNQTFFHHVGVTLTFRSTIPGLQFCVAYARANGIMAYRSAHEEDCLVADKDGVASIGVEVLDDRDRDGLLITNIVLIDNEVHTDVIHVNPILSKAR